MTKFRTMSTLRGQKEKSIVVLTCERRESASHSRDFCTLLMVFFLNVGNWNFLEYNSLRWVTKQNFNNFLEVWSESVFCLGGASGVRSKTLIFMSFFVCSLLELEKEGWWVNSSLSLLFFRRYFSAFFSVTLSKEISTNKTTNFASLASFISREQFSK